MFLLLAKTSGVTHGLDKNVILFGELYGAGVQDMQYGRITLGFRAFDISVDGKYLHHDLQAEIFSRHPEIPTVPVLYRGPFSMATIIELTDGPTHVCEPALAGRFQGREGIVVKPVRERHSPPLPNHGRGILKSISVDYLGTQGGTDND